MGVPKLTNFMNKNYSWKQMQLRAGDKIVIDGYSLCYSLYFKYHGWQLGGDYREFYEIVSSYFWDLNSSGIVPYIVIDGIDYNNEKRSTAINRFDERIKAIERAQSGCDIKRSNSILPLLAKRVFVDAINDLNLHLIVADSEADQEVVSLANHFGCPVFGNDSDYFIFNVEGGYIPINDDHGASLDLTTSRNYFHYSEFDKDFGFDDDRRRLFLPVFCGNDFENPMVDHNRQIDSETPVDQIVRSIAEMNDSEIEHYFQGGFRKVQAARSFYRVDPRSFDELMSSRLLLEINPSTPGWMLDLYKRGNFSDLSMSYLVCPKDKMWWCSVVIEDMKQTSAWEITDSVRFYIYAALLDCNKDIRSFVKIRNEKNPLPIQVGDKHLKVLESTPLADVPQLPKEKRSELVLKRFHCHKILSSINGIEEGLKLAVITSRFWLKKLLEDKDKGLKDFKLIESLICCVLSCYRQWKVPDIYSSFALGRPDTMSLIHAYAQWQCIFHDLVIFNEILGHPFKYTSPGKLFSGSYLLYYYQHDQFRVGRMTLPEAAVMFEVITKGLPLPPQLPTAASTIPENPAIATRNRFTGLKI